MLNKTNTLTAIFTAAIITTASPSPTNAGARDTAERLKQIIEIGKEICNPDPNDGKGCGLRYNDFIIKPFKKDGHYGARIKIPLENIPLFRGGR